MRRVLAPVLLLCIGCGSDGPDRRRPDGPDTAVATDRPDDTPPDSSSGSTGDTAAPATLLQGGPVVCAEPALRDDLGPMVRTTLPTDHAEVGSIWRNAGVILADLSGDGALDLFLPSAVRNSLWVGGGDGTFVDETAARLPQPTGPLEGGYGGSAADADGDGDLDVFVAANDAQDLLYRNDGAGVFTRADAGLPVETHLAGVGGAWGDMDADGDLDLMVTNFQDELDYEYFLSDPNVLLENQGDGTFTDVSEERLDRAALDGFTFLSAWVDIDADGDLDLYIVNDKGQYVSNRMMRNNGDGTFVDVSEETATDVEIWGMGLGIGDLNGDLLPDFAMSTIGDPVVLESHPSGIWVHTTNVRGLHLDPERTIGWGTALADMDNDGDLDLHMAFAPLTLELDRDPVVLDQPDGLWLQEEDGTFTQVAADWGVADWGFTRGAALADIDGDGWLDVIKRDRDGPTVVHMSRCGAEGWLRVRLRGEPPNFHGIGARIEVAEGDRTWVRWIESGSTVLASSGPPEAHFGLGLRDRVDMLRVTWPDGRVSEHADVETRQAVTVVAPGA